jgi:hypothetical protein
MIDEAGAGVFTFGFEEGLMAIVVGEFDLDGAVV